MFSQLTGSGQLSGARLELFPALSVHLINRVFHLLPEPASLVLEADGSNSHELGFRKCKGTERQTHDGEEAGKHGKVKDKWDKVDLWDESRDVFKYLGIRYLCDCRILPHSCDASSRLVCPLIYINKDKTQDR